MTGPLHSASQSGDALPENKPPPYVPDHELLRLIGSGSSGEVWLARNALGTYRAVKVVYEQTFRHKKPFEREFNGVLKVEPISRSHEGLVDILQVGNNDTGRYFYCVMELADDLQTGQEFSPDQYSPRTLAEETAGNRRLPIGECIRLGAAIASALGFLHRKGLIHRDIKPSNIILVNGQPKLADIGCVTEMSAARSYVGTEGFIPPEGPGTPQADIYSLGKVLYEISTGKDRNDYPELPASLGDTEQDRDLMQLNKTILKACRADAHQRFKTADALMSALVAIQLGKYPRQILTSGRVIGAIGIVGALVAISVILGLSWRLWWLLRHAP